MSALLFCVQELIIQVRREPWVVDMVRHLQHESGKLSPRVHQAKGHPVEQVCPKGTDERSDGLAVLTHTDVVVRLSRVHGAEHRRPPQVGQEGVDPGGGEGVGDGLLVHATVIYRPT